MLLRDRVSDEDIRLAQHSDLLQVACDFMGQPEKELHGEHYFCCKLPGHNDNKPSLRVKPGKGWSCFPCDKNGGDAISLVAALHNLDQRHDFHKVVAIIAGSGVSNYTPSAPASREPARKKDDEWTLLTDMAKAPTPPLPREHCDGLPHTDRHEFRGKDGTLVMVVDRFKRDDNKTIRPLTCWVNKDGKPEWRNKGLPKEKSRPLYRLDRLHQYGKALVVLVEGERTADVAQQRFIEAGYKPERVVVLSWHGGTSVVDKIDLEPLHGRSVTLWPDNDDVGTVAMLEIFKRLDGHVRNVRMVKTPRNVPSKWDLADPLPENFDLSGHLKNEENIIGTGMLRRMLAAVNASPAIRMLAVDNDNDNEKGGDAIAEANQHLDELQAANDPDKDTALKFTLVHGRHVRSKSGPINWLVSGIIEKEVLAILYGEPGCGKSFWALELALCIAFGIPFHGNPVKQGAAIYVAGEGFNGLGRRIDAFERKHNVTLSDDVPFYVSERSTSLADKVSARDVSEVIFKTCKEASKGAGKEIKPAIVVVDTLGRNLGPFDENQAEAINMFTVNIEHRLQKRWNATILVVHHSGKDASKGARGSSALKANVDTQYHMTKGDDKVSRLHCDKMKDAPEPDDRAYQMERIRLEFKEEDGTDAYGAVLVSTKWTEGSKKGVQGQGDNQLAAYQALADLEAENAATLEDGGFDKAVPRVTLDEWKARMKDGLGFDRNAVWRAKRDLLRDDKIVVDGPHVRTAGWC